MIGSRPDLKNLQVPALVAARAPYWRLTHGSNHPTSFQKLLKFLEKLFLTLSTVPGCRGFDPRACCPFSMWGLSSHVSEQPLDMCRLFFYVGELSYRSVQVPTPLVWEPKSNMVNQRLPVYEWISIKGAPKSNY